MSNPIPLRVLVVEDSEDDTLLLKRRLQDGGYDLIMERVATMTQMSAALEHQSWDVVIVDFSLPEFNGMTALELVQTMALDLSFIIVADVLAEAAAVQAMKAGAHDYVLKDNLTRLVPAIERELRQVEVRRKWRMAEELLRANEALMRQVIDSIPGRIADINITQRKEAESEIRRRNRELSLLNRIIAASVASSESEEVLETVCRELAAAFDLPRVTAALLDHKKMVSAVAAEFLVDGQPSARGVALPVADDPLFQYLLIHKAPVVVDNTRSDSRLTAGRERLAKRGIISALLLPLIIQNQVVGSLELDAPEARTFSAEEIGLAWNVADQIASVLARARLDKERRQLSAAIEQMVESVIITDTANSITYVNPAFERVSGYHRSEVIGQTPKILNSGRQDKQFYQELWSTLVAGRVWQGRFVNKRKDGRLFTEDATITPVRDQKGDIVNYVSVQRDVSRELQLEEQYRQSQKMEAVGRLAAGIAHDFNNLLTAINGFATLIQNELDSADPRQELVDKILHSGQRAAELVRQLLAFSRKQVVKPQVLNLNTVITSMEKMLQRIIGEHIELEISLTPDLWPVKADPAQLEQVIINLAVNASDAMPESGRLTVETTNVFIDAAFAMDHLDAQPGEHVLLLVKDTGIGMSEEVQKHMFEPFFTTKEVGKGTGLGLATVFGIVKQSNGYIWVNSEPGQGTTIKIYLPRVADTHSNSFVYNMIPTLPLGMETILLVEDETIVRELAARVLRQQGYTVLEVVNGTEAVQLVKAYDQKIHLLVTDVVMPHMHGKALAEQLKVLRPGVKILFTSGYTHFSLIQRGVLKADDMFIQKPFSPGELTRRVRQVIDETS